MIAQKQMLVMSCDICSNDGPSRVASASTTTPETVRADAERQRWRMLHGKHVCPMCVGKLAQPEPVK